MSDDKKKPEDNEERTVFIPSGGDAAPESAGGNFFETPDPTEAPAHPRSLSDPEPSPPEEELEAAAEPAPVEDETGAVAESAAVEAEAPVEAAPTAPEAAASEPPEPAPVEDEASMPEPAEPEAPAEAEAATPEPETPVEEEARTVFAPSPAEAASEAPAEPASPPPAEPPAAEAPPPAPAATSTAFAPRAHAEAIKVGDCLNHIFEVKRFLARGGMGEVFEGCNVNTDERVAIKVMLPALAADEKVVALFRKEARTLTKLQHEALVSYRVLAQEPQLGVLYIVTEFIEGVDLGDALGKVERTPDELAGLLKRLASGLAYAHRLGAVHRDLSPDNVLLPGGDVHQAKIIDFGIAKDLDAGSATIVGDGFAGKLNYVAPEQLGDYGREIGPWTDVYSLGLVMLAVAQGKNVNMSGSLVDAIDKRRKGPDLSPVPESLRPVIEAMLRPDPKERLRSMDDVIAMLGGEKRAAPPPPPPADPVKTSGGPNKALIVGGVLAVALAAGAGAWYMMDGFSPAPVEINGGIDAPPADPGDPVATARSTINSVLPSVACTWLNVGEISRSGDSVSIPMRGVAGDSTAAQREISQALAGAGVENARLDFGDVAPITPAGCAALDTYRQVRADRDLRMTAEQARFEMVPMTTGNYAGREASTALVDFDFSNAGDDYAILGIEPSGAITPLLMSRADFDSALARSTAGRPIARTGDNRYRLSVDADHEGWSGIILITGRGPFPADLVAPPFGSRGPSWQQEFLARAGQQGWRVEMAWFESVNRDASTAAPVQAVPAAAGIEELRPPADDEKPQ